MPTGLLIGPYARQVVGDRLKFWFAFKLDDGAGLVRYEGAIDPRKPLKMRNRGYFKDVLPRESCAFQRFAIPDDLAPYPALSYPRFSRDNINVAAVEMLRPQYIVDLTRARIGIPPQPANRGANGDLL